MTTGITSLGAYLPRLRLARKSIVDAHIWAAPELKRQAKGERSMCNWDEDTLTMAVEAARACLAGRDRAAITGLVLASSTLPFADRQNATVVSTALTLDESISTMDVAASQRAATTALVAAAGLAPAAGELLLVASDQRRARAGAPQELQFGDGAVAVTVGRENPIAAILGSHSVSVDFVDHYRAADRAYDYTWEERWIRDEGYGRIVPRAIDGLLKRTGLKAADFRHFVMPCLLAKGGERVAKKLGLPDGAVVDTLHGRCGETGVAHPLLMLAAALARAQPGERILLVGFGQGCDAIALEATPALAASAARGALDAALGRRKEETNYQKYLAFNGLVEKERGKRAELDKQTALTTLFRNRAMLTGLVGGRCASCGTRQFPKSMVCVNPACGAHRAQEDCSFADTPCRVMTFSADYLTYTLDPPQHYGMVQFEGGGRFLANFTDVDVGQVKVGQAMRMMFRIKDYDETRGFRRYFWKATPAGNGEA